MSTLFNGSRQDTCDFDVNFMLFILSIIQPDRFTNCTTYNLAIDLALFQYFYFMQPPPGTTPTIEGMGD
jgi:hypothetical protein